MYTFHFILVCCYATNIAMSVVLRDFPSRKNAIFEASTESLKAKCAKLGSNVEVKDTDPEFIIDRKGSLNFQLENESSLDRFTSADDGLKVPDEEIADSSAESRVQQKNVENDDDALLQTISDLLQTAGFEFLIASETLKKATVIEELASSNSPFEDISDEDDFNAFLIEDNDCEEIHAFELKDSDSKNDSMPLASMGNDSFEFFSSAEANQSVHTELVLLIPDSSMESFQKNNSIFENKMDVSINTPSSEIEATNVDTDFVLLIPDGGIEHFRESSNGSNNANEGGLDFSFDNVSSSEIKTTRLELVNNLPTAHPIVSPPLKVPEMTTEITGNLSGVFLVMSTSNEGPLVEMSEVIETSSNNLTSSETLVIDSNVTISETLVTGSNVTIAEEKKCPPGGFCLFSFAFRDTCTEHSDCRGNRFCCKSGCSKKCLDL